MNKRGLSSMITALLVIFLIFVVIGIALGVILLGSDGNTEEVIDDSGEEENEDSGDVEFCGDLIVDVDSEECDGGVNCLGDCSCETGHVSDASNGCVIDESINCDGVFEEGEQCDGGDLCVECACPDGYEAEGVYPDGNGGCIQILSLVRGSVEEVWPAGTGMYFASSALPNEENVDYTGDFVAYTDALVCKTIFNYVTTIDSSYPLAHIAFSSNTNPLIEVGDEFEIWGSQPECEDSTLLV